MRRLSLLALAVSLVACADPEEDRANPPSGLWAYMDGGVVQNTCGTEDIGGDPDTNFSLTNNGDGTFTVDQNNEEDFDCNIDGETFECPYRIGGSETFDEVSATINWRVRIDGSFPDDTRMIGEQTIDFTCEGAGCSNLGLIGVTVPCNMVVAFTAEKS